MKYFSFLFKSIWKLKESIWVFFEKHIGEWTNYSDANMPLLSGWGHHYMSWQLNSSVFKGIFFKFPCEKEKKGRTRRGLGKEAWEESIIRFLELGL